MLDAEAPKKYDDLTSLELHNLSESFAIRLHLFNYEYPRFLPQTVKGIMEHKNLNDVDRNLLEHYCRMFELDWRGDQQFSNKEEMLATNPVYVTGSNTNEFGRINNEKASQMLK